MLDPTARHPAAAASVSNVEGGTGEASGPVDAARFERAFAFLRSPVEVARGYFAWHGAVERVWFVATRAALVELGMLLSGYSEVHYDDRPVDTWINSYVHWLNHGNAVRISTEWWTPQQPYFVSNNDGDRETYTTLDEAECSELGTRVWTMDYANGEEVWALRAFQERGAS